MSSSNTLIAAMSQFCRPLLLSTFIATLSLAQLGTMSAYAVTNQFSWPTIALQPIQSGFDSPVNIVSARDGTQRLFVLERGGRILIVQDGQRLATPFLDISDRVMALCDECGLLGLAFPPDFAEQGYFFVHYISNTEQAPPDTDDPDTMRDTVIARFHLTADPNVADPASEEHILTINKPQGSHNGGHILFGPDNFLYIGMGDGGGTGDEYDNADNPESLLGKILRIEVGATGTYSVPLTNPFVNDDDYRAEIWASGLRNPWRFTFDRLTGDFYLADVGQDNFEEVNYLASGMVGNGGQAYGWPTLEGNVCYPPSGRQNCEREGYVSPVIVYEHSANDCSVIGGHLYRSAAPSQAPLYLYGDFCSGRIWGLQHVGATWATQMLIDAPFLISSFGEDESGAIYVIDYGGTIYRIMELSFVEYMPLILQ